MIASATRRMNTPIAGSNSPFAADRPPTNASTLVATTRPSDMTASRTGVRIASTREICSSVSRRRAPRMLFASSRQRSQTKARK